MKILNNLNFNELTRSDYTDKVNRKGSYLENSKENENKGKSILRNAIIDLVKIIILELSICKFYFVKRITHL